MAPRVKPDQLGRPLKLTSFSVNPPLNAKNVGSGFAKSDSQAHWSRNRGDEAWSIDREAKRRRMMASEEELQVVERDLRDGEKAMINVLASSSSAPVLKGVDISAVAQVTEASASTGFDPMTKTIVIHPGSRWLRIGRASDAFPATVPNVIARKIPNFVPPTSKGKEREALIVHAEEPITVMSAPELLSVNYEQALTNQHPIYEEDDEMVDDLAVIDSSDPLASKINLLRGELRARMRLYKLRGALNAKEQALSFNTASRAERVAEYNDPDEIEWTNVSEGLDFYVGQEALRIPSPAETGYTLRYPYSRGTFDTTGYDSAQELLGDIERIWLETLEKELEITRADLKEYSAILIIPDLYDQLYIREMAAVMLNGLGFKQMCFQQEGLCASFGAGLSTACIVDIGARKTSISCVEDGLVLPETRIVLDYGGDDITEFLFTLLSRSNFPYREADLSRWQDFLMIEKLKESMVVLSEADVGLNTFEFYARAPDKPTLKYEIKAYEDVVLAPYTLFSPQIIDSEKKVPSEQNLWSTIYHDGFDLGGNPITRAMRDSVRSTLTPSAAIPRAPSSIATLNPVDPIAASASTIISFKSSSTIPASSPTLSTAAPIVLSEVDIRSAAGKIPLHIAVVQSILAANSEDRMRRVCSNVLVVGGTGLIHNVGFAIESRAAPILAEAHPGLTNAMTIIPPPHEIDPRILAWKGISVLSKLEVANEVWVRKEDWEVTGLKAVRERGVFFL